MRELQLVETHRRGGAPAQEALCELVRAYQRRVYSICMRMVRNRDDAAELTQDVLIKLIENLGSYNGQSKLSTWVIRITMNCCLSHLRRQKTRGHEPLEHSDPYGTHVDRTSPVQRSSGLTARSSSGELSPVSRVEHDQMRSSVLSALESLDHDSRAILVLRDLQDLDYQQLAEVLEVPIGTVKSRLFRARAALRAALESREGV